MKINIQSISLNMNAYSSHGTRCDVLFVRNDKEITHLGSVLPALCMSGESARCNN